MIKRLSTKNPIEEVILTFDFTNELLGDAGNTIESVVSATVYTHSGIDPSPESILNGSAYVDAEKKKVFVPVKGGLEGRGYTVTVKVGTDNSAFSPALSAILPVSAK